ncbi:MAG TPA: DUF4383 domain-containing protein [Ardenticatenaceae bacterium]|nr:DUF4383 domain-containing protein [Ardenticatenaceae bacterium]
MSVRNFALIFGIVYVLVGILGFIPGIAQDAGAAPPQGEVIGGVRNLLGLFPINVVHNIVHLLIGLAGLAASRAYSSSRAYARAVAIVYGLLTIMGLIPATDNMFGLAPLWGHDIWLHALSALVAAYFGWMAPEETTTGTGRVGSY